MARPARASLRAGAPATIHIVGTTKRRSEDLPGQALPLLRALLNAVEHGELTAPGPMVAHLHGSLAALEALERPPERAISKRFTQ
jgi:hypothetical protein